MSITAGFIPTFVGQTCASYLCISSTCDTANVTWLVASTNKHSAMLAINYVERNLDVLWCCLKVVPALSNWYRWRIAFYKLLIYAFDISETSSDRCSSISSSSNMDTRREDSPLLPPSSASTGHHPYYYYRLTHVLFPNFNVSEGIKL